MSWLIRLGRGAACSLLATVALAAPAAAITYAPVAQPGPRLDVAQSQLDQSLRCTGNLVSSGRAAVLFIPPTLVNANEAYFAYEDALSSIGTPYCTLTIPFYTTEDIQLSAEYVVFAVRTMYAQTGQRVQMLGWSQGGGPEPRWALRFWPDIRPMVSKLIDLEAPNHGTIVIHSVCTSLTCISPLCPTRCVPALWQQADDSMFIAALNSGQETFPGIAYTNVYSHTSQFVQPNLDSSGTTSLHGGGGQIANIATQAICPLNLADHLAYYYDPVAYAIVTDALNHPGPADATRISRSVCAQISNPFVPVSEIPAYTLFVYDAIFVNRLLAEPQTTQEPALKCYVTASCTGNAANQRAAGAKRAPKGKAKRHKPHRNRHSNSRRHKSRH
jgi:hypothetical protein